MITKEQHKIDNIMHEINKLIVLETDIRWRIQAITPYGILFRKTTMFNQDKKALINQAKKFHLHNYYEIKVSKDNVSVYRLKPEYDNYESKECIITQCKLTGII